jgi:hypothetical protein
MVGALVGVAALAALLPAAGRGDGQVASAAEVRVYRFAAGPDTPVLRGGGEPVIAPRFAQKVTVVGRLGFYPSGRGLRGAVVQVVSPTNSVVAAALTDRRGRFVVRWQAKENGQFAVAAVGVAHTSRVVTVRLRPRIRVLGTGRRARAGEALLIRGAVRPSFAGGFLGSVYLQVYQGPSGGWITRANAPIGADGGFALRYVVRGGGGRTLSMRVITPKTPGGWASGTSRRLTMRVR